MEDSFYKKPETTKASIKSAEGIDGKELIVKLNELLPTNSKVLEIGSGPGSDYKIFHENHEVVGSDFSDAFLTHLKAAYPDGKFLHLDAISLETELKFDAIYSNKVLHHLSNEELMGSIERQFALLNINGLLCHSFWRGSGDEIFKGLFVNYHEENDLRKLFSTSFEIISIDRYEEFEKDDSLLIIARRR